MATSPFYWLIIYLIIDSAALGEFTHSVNTRIDGKPDKETIGGECQRKRAIYSLFSSRRSLPENYDPQLELALNDLISSLYKVRGKYQERYRMSMEEANQYLSICCKKKYPFKEITKQIELMREKGRIRQWQRDVTGRKTGLDNLAERHAVLAYMAVKEAQENAILAKTRQILGPGCGASSRPGKNRYVDVLGLIKSIESLKCIVVIETIKLTFDMSKFEP